MRYICELEELEALALQLAERCRELGPVLTVGQSRTLAANMLGHTGHADFLDSLANPDREDLDFFLEEGKTADEPEFQEHLILGLIRIGFDWPLAKDLGQELFEQLSSLPVTQQLPIAME